MAKGFTYEQKDCEWCGKPIDLPRHTKAKYHKGCSRQAHIQKGIEWKKNHTGYDAEWVKRNPDKAKERKEYQREYARKKGKEAKRLVFSHYGEKCECCGESNIEFLAIDHINGGGRKHREKIGHKAGWPFYLWLIKNNFPEGYRTLCHNCNMSMGFYGYCPHKRNKANS